MAPTYIDSNVFFYAKIGDRLFGESCARVVRSIAKGRTKASISVLVPLEVTNAMRKYGLGKEAADETSAILSLGMDTYPFEPSDLEEVAEVFEQTQVSPYDCVHAVVMKRYGVKQIISADDDFDQFPWLKRVDPRAFQEG